jgi:hypothetical protein
MLIFAEGGKPENPEKNPLSKGENQQQTQITCNTESWNRTQVTVVRGKRSTATPHMLPNKLLYLRSTQILASNQLFVNML